MPSLKVTTSILYGIFVSEKSFLIGIRCLVKQEHSRMLALRVAGEHLPAELVDEIADHLYALEKPDIVSRWKADDIQDGNYHKFCYGVYAETEADRRAMERLGELNVNAVWISNSRPSRSDSSVGKLQETQQDCNYIHLSALKSRPHLFVALPPKCPTQYPNGIAYPTAKAILSVTTTASGGSPDQESLPADQVEYTTIKCSLLNPRNVVKKSKPKGRKTMSVSRLLSVEGLEAAMRDWDADALKRYVDLLELCVIRTDRTQSAGDEEARMKPGVFVFQGWEDE